MHNAYMMNLIAIAENNCNTSEIDWTTKRS